MEVIFFNIKIRDDLFYVSKQSPEKTGKYIDLLETFGNRLRMPYSKQLDKNLYELRIRGKQEIRILYCFYKNQAVIVHSFVKKTQTTPRKEIEIALSRISLLQ